jgi:hypothetical protein
MCGRSLNATFCPFLGLCATADQLLRRFRRPLYTGLSLVEPYHSMRRRAMSRDMAADALRTASSGGASRGSQTKVRL